MMIFNEFTEEITKKIKEFLPDSYKEATVKIDMVMKNNDLKLTGISICKPDNNICPTIYLDGFYDEYKSGKDIKIIMKEIAKLRIDRDIKKKIDTKKFQEYEAVKKFIAPKIIHKEWNKVLLEQRPHKIICDLAVTYHILVDQNMKGTATTPVTNDMMNSWKVDVDTLHAAAIKNMQTICPATFHTMQYELNRIMNNDEEDDNEGFRSEDFMYVLSNKQRLNGANAILDRRIMEKIKDKLKDFYIIPSSIHEFIIVKSSGNTDPELITEMIKEVNGDVEPEIRLSDHPYKYKDGLFF